MTQTPRKQIPTERKAAIRKRWEAVRERGRTAFTIAFTLIVMGIACEICLAACVLAWPIISHMSDARILMITIAAAIVVFVIAPIAGVVSSRSVWSWLDRQFTR